MRTVINRYVYTICIIIKEASVFSCVPQRWQENSPSDTGCSTCYDRNDQINTQLWMYWTQDL